MKKNIQLLVLALVLVIAGSALYYYYGYKDSFLLHMVAYCLIIYGWLMAVFMLIFLHPKRPATTVFKKKSATIQAWKHRVFFLVYLVWGCAVAMNFIAGSTITENRITRILEEGPSGEATAVVTSIRTRFHRGSKEVHAIIEYPTGSGTVTQALSNYGYSIGQKLRVRYSEKYPDMFVLLPLSLQE